MTTDDNNENKKENAKKKCVIKRKLKFKSYEDCLEATELQNKINQI